MNRACITLAVLTGVAPEYWAETGWRGIATAEAVIRELAGKGGSSGDDPDVVMGG